VNHLRWISLSVNTFSSGLLGGGPGLNFDFARLSFHVPAGELLCAYPMGGKAMANAEKSSAVAVSVVRRFMMILAVFARRWHFSVAKIEKGVLYIGYASADALI
jgi:hypothetical protein